MRDPFHLVTKTVIPQRAALPLHRQIIWVFGSLAFACIVGGIVAIHQNAKSETKLDILGAHLTTGHVGVAFVGLGLIIGLFTVRAVLKSQRELASLPPFAQVLDVVPNARDTDEGHQPLDIETLCNPKDKFSTHCALRVTNPSVITSADDVTVEISDFSLPTQTKAPMEMLAVKESFKSPRARTIHPKASQDFELFVINDEDLGFAAQIFVVLHGLLYNESFKAGQADDWVDTEGLPPRLKECRFTVSVTARDRPQVRQTFKMRFLNKDVPLKVEVSKV